MAFGEKKPGKSSEPPPLNVIELNAQMNGSLSFQEPVDLRINGHFRGNLDVKGALTVGASADVEADITGDYIVVAGKVKGKIFASRLLTLMPTAVLIGDIHAPKLNVVEGALFQGVCRMAVDEVVSSEEIFDLKGLSTYLEIEEGVILELVRAGKIPVTKDGDLLKFERAQIDQWAAAGTTK
ncbi:MAG: polymer-forming cytoskeletal protein [Candidatus Omnitrophota bacterium]